MILTRQNITFYLLERGLLTMKEVVCDGVSVIEQSHRNRNFLVRRSGRGGFFVKQSQEWEQLGQRHSTLSREAACYQLAQGNSHLERLIPKYHDFSARSHVLVVDLVEPSQSLASFHATTDEFPVELGACLGRQLAVCHSEFGKMLRFLDRRHPFIGEAPWILNPDDLSDFVSDEQSVGQALVINLIKKNPELYERLKALSNSWQINGIIHGDMKWANCLLRTDNHDDEVPDWDVRIVDWELADAGHVAWDVAGILQCYLQFWVDSMDFDAGGTIEELAASASPGLAEMQPSMRAFWDSYLGQMDVPAAARSTLRRRAVEYAAARVLQTAFENRDREVLLGPRVVLLLQLSANIMADPETASDQLFGLS